MLKTAASCQFRNTTVLLVIGGILFWSWVDNTYHEKRERNIGRAEIKKPAS